MKVYCAWCQAEGRAALIGEKLPLDDDAATHGICVQHQARWLTADAPSPLNEVLVVVSPERSDVYEDLARLAPTVQGMRVIVDRRRADRRSPSTQATELGYTIVSLPPPSVAPEASPEFTAASVTGVLEQLETFADRVGALRVSLLRLVHDTDRVAAIHERNSREAARLGAEVDALRRDEARLRERLGRARETAQEIQEAARDGLRAIVDVSGTLLARLGG